jgi:hypothetical protein
LLFLSSSDMGRRFFSKTCWSRFSLLSSTGTIFVMFQNSCLTLDYWLIIYSDIIKLIWIIILCIFTLKTHGWLPVILWLLILT